MKKITRKEFLSMAVMGTGVCLSPKIIFAEELVSDYPTQEATGDHTTDPITLASMKAQQYFVGEYNCAQAVLLAVNEANGKTCDCCPQIAAGFGGGLKMGEVCGALSGAILAAGVQYADDEDGSQRVHEKTQRITRTFRDAYGGVRCEEIRIDKTICGEYVKTAVRAALST